MTLSSRKTAIVTGGSRGFGHALTSALVAGGWHVVLDARDAARLARSVEGLPTEAITAVPGDVTDPEHRRALAGAAERAGGAHLLVNNASMLGPSPQPPLAAYPLDVLERVYAVNVIAPLALTQLVLEQLTRSGGQVVNISSDAAIEPYEGWGGYGSAKAALDQLTAILGAEHADLRVYGFDPGDMNTDLHQQAFPGEDISDRAAPESVVPALLSLLSSRRPSGRYRAADLLSQVPA